MPKHPAIDLFHKLNKFDLSQSSLKEHTNLEVGAEIGSVLSTGSLCDVNNGRHLHAIIEKESFAQQKLNNGLWSSKLQIFRYPIKVNTIKKYQVVDEFMERYLASPLEQKN